MARKKVGDLLRSSDPTERKQGVRMVAGMGNEKALRILMGIYKQDPDEDVREYAKRGAAHVAERIREQREAEVQAAEPEPAPAPEAAPLFDDDEDFEEEPLEEVEVDPKMEKMAKAYIGEALDHQTNNDKPKAIKALVKAMNTNPNLRKDNYFMGVAGSILGMDAEKAVRALRDQDKRKKLVEQDKAGKEQKAVASHMEDAEKHTWGTLVVDITLFIAIAFLGGLFSVMVIDYGAGVQLNAIESQLVELEAEDTDESEEQIEALENRIPTLEAISEAMSVGVGFGLGLGVVLVLLPAVILLGVVLQPIATRILNGAGTTPYVIFKLLNVYNIPLIASFGLIILGAVMIFIAGVPLNIGTLIVLGGLGLVQLVIAIRVILAVGSAYNFGALNGFLALLIANIPIGIIQGLVVVLLSAILGAVLGPMIQVVTGGL